MVFFKPLLSIFLALSVHLVSAQVPIWGQCGGIGYNGSTQCASGLTCVKQNDWYSQCLQGPAQPTTTTSPQFPGGPTTTVTTTNPGPTGGTGTPLSSIPAGTLTALRNFGSNPTNVGISVYKPSSLKANPGLLVALHYCGGTAQAYFSGTQFRQLADQRGFLALYGQAPGNSNCWDVTSSATLKHDGGGDSLGIASAVRFAIANWGVDPEKVFVVGTSSGAMMTNVLAGSYPDLFKAGAVFAGVGFGCLTTSAPSNPPDRCAQGQNIQTAQQWGDRVRAAYPGYTGSYPKMQIWHGTADNVLNYANFAEELKQWTNVHGISQTPASTAQNNPKSGWTKTTYGSGQVIGYSGSGAGHGLPESGTESVAIDWFGL